MSVTNLNTGVKVGPNPTELESCFLEQEYVIDGEPVTLSLLVLPPTFDEQGVSWPYLVSRNSDDRNQLWRRYLLSPDKVAPLANVHGISSEVRLLNLDDKESHIWLKSHMRCPKNMTDTEEVSDMNNHISRKGTLESLRLDGWSYLGMVSIFHPALDLVSDLGSAVVQKVKENKHRRIPSNIQDYMEWD